MARTRTTPNAKLSPKHGTSSGTNPEENFESPEDLSDVAGIDAEIPRGSARPSGNLLQPKPKPRSPIGLEIGKSAGGGLGVVAAVPLGGPISARGGINLGAGGEIKGGSLGLGIGLGPLGASIDVGVDQDEEGRGGCYQYVTVSVGPFAHTYGRNVCEPKPSPEIPTPPPPAPTPVNNLLNFPSPLMPNNPSPPPTYAVGCQVWQRILRSGAAGWGGMPLEVPKPDGIDYQNYDFFVAAQQYFTFAEPDWIDGEAANYRVRIYLKPTAPEQFVFSDLFGRRLEPTQARWDGIVIYKIVTSSYRYFPNGGAQNFIDIYTRVELWRNSIGGVFYIAQKAEYTVDSLCKPVAPLFPLSPPILNPPPRKKMDDVCCKKSLILQAEILRLLGRELGPEGLVSQTKKAGFIGEEIERIETPILDPEKPKKIKVRFETVYDLLKYALKQANNLDTALDPQSYKPPTGKIQNPAYNRDSEQSLKSNDQPNRDKLGNKRELEINKDDEVKMGGFLQQQQYVFDALRRLEYLFPSGELSDALVAKSLLIPGAVNEIKIHNMIMAYEIQMMYLNATFGNPREVLTIKDANPAIEGDQPIEVAALTLSDWFRQVVKFQIDTGGDVDAAVNLMLRDFRTNLANRTDIIKTAEMTQALFEDSGMREQQDYIPVHLEGDPYAGQWVKGQGFQANPDLEKKTEEATEKVLRETMKPTEIKLKVSRRHKEEKTDMRDLLRGLADFIQRLLSIPSAGDAGTAIDKLIESAKFKVQTEAALLRANVIKAATASRNRTKKRKK